MSEVLTCSGFAGFTHCMGGMGLAWELLNPECSWPLVGIAALGVVHRSAALRAAVVSVSVGDVSAQLFHKARHAGPMALPHNVANPLDFARPGIRA